MKSRMTTNSQLSTNEPKKKKTKLNKQLEQEEIHQRSHGGLSVGSGRGENAGKGTGNKKHKW